MVPKSRLFFWIQNNVPSSKYTWNKIKFPCDLFPKWLYTLVKKLKITKKLDWKECLAYLHGNIYWCPNVHMRKIYSFRKPLLVIANLFLNYCVNCQASRGILNFLLWVAIWRKHVVIHKWPNLLPKWYLHTLSDHILLWPAQILVFIATDLYNQ